MSYCRIEIPGKDAHLWGEDQLRDDVGEKVTNGFLITMEPHRVVFSIEQQYSHRLVALVQALSNKGFI